MICDDIKLEELRLIHGNVVRIEYKEVSGQLNHLVVRKPNFDEYLFFNKNANILENQTYELDSDVADIYFDKVLVFPKDAVNINKIPVGIIIQACNTSIKISEFENDEKIRDLYIRSIRCFNTQPGAMVLKILAAYGIQGFLAAKTLNEDQIIDLLVAAEALTNSYGDFGKLVGMQNLPYKHNGKLDVGKLIGLKTDEKDVPNPLDKAKRDKLRAYYSSLGYTDDKIEKMLQSIEHNERRFDYSATTEDGRVDIGRMDDNDMKNMSREQYKDMMKDGKILSHDESIKRSIDHSKDILSKVIEEDKARYGDRDTNNNGLGAKHFKGDLSKLLKIVNENLKQEELG